MNNFKLGAVLGNKDPRNLKLSNYLTTNTLASPPSVIDWDKDVMNRYRMWYNDHAGDCVFAAFYNMEAGASGATGNTFSATDNDVIADYSAVTGYDPNTGLNDNGTNPEDALRYYSKNGKVLAWGEVNHRNLTEVRQAIQIFGGIYTGLSLPKSAQAQIGSTWDTMRFPKDLFNITDWTPGSWGGHCVITRHADFSQSRGIFNCITWGKSQEMTQDFWNEYVSVAYFMITPLWISQQSNLTPSGLDLTTLINDVKQLTQ